VSFSIYPGETLGLVGESGSGKTSLGRSILRLIAPDSGEVRFNGKDLLSLSNSELRPLRKRMQMVFQDPFSSLNPRMTIGEAISEPMIIHGLALKEEERKDKAIQLLERVGLKASHYHRLPHEFSGGQRQRAGIARALASEPDFIIFDESVSSLDVSAQALILNLINDLKERYKFTCLFISHDLSVVRYMSDRVVVMQKGAIEEIAEADQLFASPQSTYTQGLIASIPLGGTEDIDLAIAQKRNRNTA
jgi:peptide/nickel transport system ATP-binding protein